MPWRIVVWGRAVDPLSGFVAERGCLVRDIESFDLFH